MKKVKVKVPAKINLTLDVLGKEGEYHLLSSLVTSASVYDKFTLTARTDGVVNVTFEGLPAFVDGNSSHAKKAGEMFRDKFCTNGADIRIKRAIPAKGGMGGSSADVAGVLNGMKKLYGVKYDLSEIANALGSDTAYMLGGGTAVISGRGEKIKRVKPCKNFYLLFITESDGVSTPLCFAEFDRRGLVYPYRTAVAVKFMENGDVENLFKVLKNDLFVSANALNPKVGENLSALRKFCPALMTGGGSAVFGGFRKRSDRNKAYKKLYDRFGESLIKAKTINKI